MSDITITITVPDGLKVPRASLWLEPETTREFEAYLDALGGITRGHLDNRDSYITFDVDGARAYLFYPKDLAPPQPPTPTPKSAFAATLKQRQREARDFMAELESAASS